MNIAQLLMSGSIQGQPSTQTQGADLKEATQDFEGLLAGMLTMSMNGGGSLLAQVEASALGGTPMCVLSNQKISEEQLLAMLQQTGDALTTLSDKLEEIMAALLSGQKIEPQIEGVKGVITETISKLSESPEKTKGNSLIINALLSLEAVLDSEGAQSALEKSVETLPESLKVKLHLHLKDAAKAGSAEGSEIDMLRFKLIAHVINADNNADKADNAGQVQADKAGVPNQHANIMATMRSTGSIHAKLLNAAPVALENTEARQLTVSPLPVSNSAIGAKANASEAAPNAVRAQQTASVDAMTFAIDDAKVAVVDTAPAGEVCAKEDKGTTEPQVDDMALIEVAGSEIDEGKSESGASRDARSETNLQLNGSVAERNSSVSKGAFAEYVTNNTQSAKAGVADPHGVVSQVSDNFVEKFDMLLAGGKGEARIQLHPKHLGELKIHLLVENGSMKAVLDASTHQVKELLEANLQSLRQSLESQGIQVGRFDVSVGQQGRGGQGSYQNRNGMSAEQGLINGEGEVPKIRASINIEGNMTLNLLA